MTYILGISAFYHDSAAALLHDGEIISAVQEERFSREKYDARFPTRSVEHCLNEAGISPAQLDFVAFYEQPLTKFERLIETYVSYAPAGFESFRQAIPVWIGKKLHLPREIRRGLGRSYQGPIFFPSHHESHAASAFFASPFREAAILTMDGVGEWATTTVGHGQDNRIELTRQLKFPHSLGLLYSAFTYYCGFKVNSGEYKLMGLAPYGEPRFLDLIYQHLIDVKPDGSYHMEMSYFNYAQGLTMTTEKFHRLFGGPPRKPESRLDQRHMDVAASVQKVCEEIVLRSARYAWEQSGQPENLVMAGGVALNCVANGRVLREGPFRNIWIQPASGDAGGALGAALFVWHQLLEKPRQQLAEDIQRASHLGPQYSDSEVRRFLDGVGANYCSFDDEAALLNHVATAMSEGKIIGWFHGRAEFGPRALGARSIIGDARSPSLQSDLNIKVKFRESFRPFAPCVLREQVHNWFEMRPGEDSPYMLMVAPVREQHRAKLTQEEIDCLLHEPDLSRRVNLARSTVPAITHVDYSARVQTVDERHGRFYRLIQTFYEKTGCPVIINTSFNLSWEPIVLTPEQAYQTFMHSEMDTLVLENCVLHKAEQPLGFRVSIQSTAGRGQDNNPWADPLSGEPLLIDADAAVNPATGKVYPVDEGILRLFVPTIASESGAADVTETVKQFYEKTPFPNYEEMDNRRALLEKARNGIFARLLNEQIPFDARVVEIGCGTGQLTNFLASAHRSVIGVDVCLNSLRLAQDFKIEHGLTRATFAQMNLFRPGLRDGFFDYVISNGVLHHTADARRAFMRISRLLKPGGYVVVGLYNAYSRQLHYARRALFRWTGLTSRWLDPHFGKVSANGKREAWFQDQYCHPQESCHTLSEVMKWLDDEGLEFVNSIPKPALGQTLSPNENLFAAQSSGTPMGRLLNQLAYLGDGYREGGFFVVIARRRIEPQ